MRCAWLAGSLLASTVAVADDVAVTEPAKPASPVPPAANPMPVAESMPNPDRIRADEEELRPQIQVDGGLSVIGPAYEHPITKQIAVHLEAFIFGTYFLPWFDAGEKVRGFGAGVRPTWFMRPSGRGLYVAPYFRVVAVDDETLTGAESVGFTTGAFVGWAFGLGKKLDLRVGAGAQYIYFRTETDMGEVSTSTPFVAIDAVLGYRL